MHQDYDYIATMPGMVHRFHYLPQLRRYPGMSTLVAARPHWSPPSPELALPVLRSVTWPSMPAIIIKFNYIGYGKYSLKRGKFSKRTAIVTNRSKQSSQTTRTKTSPRERYETWNSC